MKKIIFYNNDFIKNLFEKKFSNKKNTTFIMGTIQDKIDSKIFKESEILVIHISSKVNKKIIDKFENLKMIATYSTGTDHIDLKYAQSKNILVKNVPAYGARSVAEHSLALLFNVSQKINISAEFLKKEKDFLIKERDKIRGFKLEGKKIGILGVGKIGKEMIKICRGLGLDILAFDIFKDEKFAKKYNFKYTSFNNLIKNSDIISLHLPSLEKTKYILGAKEFKEMKNGIVIINTARGALIESRAFLKNLKNGKILGAGLDVLENENDIFNKNFKTKKEEKIAKINREILKEKNVLITPHNAYNTNSAIEIVVEKTVENIKNFEKENKKTIS